MLSAFPVEEVIQVEIASLKRLLKLDQDIIFITDRFYWDSMFTTKKVKKTHFLAGAASANGENYIFINIEELDTLKETKKTICHELLHIKYPKATESQIERLTKNYIN